MSNEKQERLDGYQAKKSNPPEKRTPPKGDSNVTPPSKEKKEKD
ncbi:hypothetical protein [Microcoleus sp. B4-C1]